MKFHTQRQLYDKENGVRGSCYPTALACLLDLEIDEVPNFQLAYWSKEEEANILKILLHRYCNGSYDTAEDYQKANFNREKSRMYSQWANILEFWLASKGYTEEYIMCDQMDEWLKNNPDTPYMVKGMSKRGVGHVVIYKNGEMIHDPHPSGEGLVGLNNEPYTYLQKNTSISYITSHIDEIKKQTSKKTSAANKGRQHSKESRLNMSKAQSEREAPSQKTKDQISKTLFGFKNTNTSSKYIGVSFIVSQNLYRATIRFNRKGIIIGYFKDEVHAAIAYNNKTIELYGP